MTVSKTEGGSRRPYLECIERVAVKLFEICVIQELDEVVLLFLVAEGRTKRERREERETGSLPPPCQGKTISTREQYYLDLKPVSWSPLVVTNTCSAPRGSWW